MKKFFAILLFLFVSSTSFSQVNIFKDSVFTSGSTYYGNNSFTIYMPGNLPLIFSAPHGGPLGPSEIPDRSGEGISTDNDLRTKEMAQYVYQEINALTGKYPHVVINNLKRIKLDANRDSVEAAMGNELALFAWKEYQSFIAVARNEVESDFSKGLYIDLHGHGHTIQRLEIGYLLSSTQLGKSNYELNAGNYGDVSSIKNLTRTNPHSLSFAELLRGEFSLGAFFANAGIPAVPSPQIGSPETDPYFSGGYCTELYGSLYGGAIDGIQIEHNRIGIRDSDTNVRAYAKKLAQVILDYFKYHYNMDLTSADDEAAGIDPGFELYQNYPNPFNPSTKIRYSIPTVETRRGVSLLTKIIVYDMLGREVAVLINEQKAPGNYEVSFNAANLPSGVYFYKLTAGNYSNYKKMILLK